MSDAYKKAGVDLTAGYAALKTVKQLSGNDQLGAFGGVFPLAGQDLTDPVLVAGSDGVGTKLLVAIAAHQHTTIGIDLVAMCVNDVLAQGARPLFFLDYLGLGKTESARVQAILTGVVAGCRQAGTQLIGGETAEMPDMYTQDHYDLAGFAVGIVSRQDLLDPDNVRAGDVLIGLPSNGLHANGFSLVRDILFKQHDLPLETVLPELGHSLQEELLRPTQIYVESVWPLLAQHRIASMAHITGGGLIENVARALPSGLSAELALGSWPVPAIMTVLSRLGQLTPQDLRETFNLGLGMLLVVHPEQVAATLAQLAAVNQPAYRVGRVGVGETPVVFKEATHG
ncbi:MAG: phosphoribosylformylglycinamidine cyclo-ligase [Levilactobacillus sp.]|jgi:phosphoribosylformylglycinamidine cyclo-ligase|uniref:phosphoribosylformylglycinamidine cyclo-ligase n=1 Tax=Levilactobacillus sp. TaxID=2767919 RepID=UPI002588B99E|nr:phosphoribosylformylglycinamidine cyclo-ligase [Levilactobacillus sp.]MCH4123069.1 phosphoribosylformylglycinamidine cyclo-ligase [Levilactobacillus sp.]MCI1552793.1 phosphoribosylformylglycinamidine cyclo-ligase [Levilactobacillus sp.]MCI1598882.1 phosphoribosylformylglycinamidine cyclo-ligase [Levilactobacillus sp.]